MAVDGKVGVTSAEFGAGAEILNRPPYEGVSMTLDFESVEVMADNGEKVVKAGTPIDKDGKPTEIASNAVGILLFDVYQHRPQGTILKKAYLNLKRIKDNLSDKYDTYYGTITELNTALPMIVFEEEPGE